MNVKKIIKNSFEGDKTQNEIKKHVNVLLKKNLLTLFPNINMSLYLARFLSI
jgi:hypothetical protein